MRSRRSSAPASACSAISRTKRSDRTVSLTSSRRRSWRSSMRCIVSSRASGRGTRCRARPAAATSPAARCTAIAIGTSPSPAPMVAASVTTSSARSSRTRPPSCGGSSPRRPAAAVSRGSRYLLSGLLLCGECGWGLHATHRTSQRGEPQRYYVCTAYRTRGETVCTNRYSAPMEGVHAEVLATLRRKVLKPDLVRDVVGRALELRAARPAALEEQRQALAGELQRLETELRRYAEAVGAGDHPLPALLEAMGAREQRRREIRAQLEELATPRVHVTDVAVYGEASRRLTDWQGLLERHPADARGVLQDLLRGRLVVTPTLI